MILNVEIRDGPRGKYCFITFTNPQSVQQLLVQAHLNCNGNDIVFKKDRRQQNRKDKETEKKRNVGTGRSLQPRDVRRSAGASPADWTFTSPGESAKNDKRQSCVGFSYGICFDGAQCSLAHRYLEKQEPMLVAFVKLSPPGKVNPQRISWKVIDTESQILLLSGILSIDRALIDSRSWSGEMSIQTSNGSTVATLSAALGKELLDKILRDKADLMIESINYRKLSVALEDRRKDLLHAEFLKAEASAVTAVEMEEQSRFPEKFTAKNFLELENLSFSPEQLVSIEAMAFASLNFEAIHAGTRIFEGNNNNHLYALAKAKCLVLDGTSPQVFDAIESFESNPSFEKIERVS
jgi:hypothetical protein